MIQQDELASQFTCHEQLKVHIANFLLSCTIEITLCELSIVMNKNKVDKEYPP
jgi:hypothetical protein